MKTVCETIVKPSLNLRDGQSVEEWLRWTYQDQFAHTVTVDDDLRVIQHDTRIRSCGAGFEQMERLGCLVQSGGAGPVHLHEDAEAVHQHVMALGTVARGLVIMHAVAGNRPDYLPGAIPRPVMVPRGNGKPKVEYWDGLEKRQPAYCVLRYDPLPEHIDFMREVWTVWWDAVADVAGRMRADGFAVLDLPIRRTPWLDIAEKI